MESFYDSSLYSSIGAPLYHPYHASAYMSGASGENFPIPASATVQSSNTTNNSTNSSISPVTPGNENNQDIKSENSSPKLDSSSASSTTSSSSANSSFTSNNQKFASITPPLSTSAANEQMLNPEYLSRFNSTMNSTAPYQFLASPISHYPYNNYLHHSHQQSMAHHNSHFNPYSAYHHGANQNQNDSANPPSYHSQHFLQFPSDYSYFLNNSSTSTPTNLNESKLTTSASSISSNSSLHSLSGQSKPLSTSISKNMAHPNTSPISSINAHSNRYHGQNNNVANVHPAEKKRHRLWVAGPKK